MVTVTDKAKEKVKNLIQDSGLDSSYFLRVSVKGGGCSGLSYNLDFDNEEQKGDQFFDCLLYTSPSPRDRQKSRMPSSA